MTKIMKIGNRVIGEDQPPFIICEISGNHNGSIERAKKLITEGAKTGCDAVKLQTYTPDTLTLNSKKSDFLIDRGLWAGKSLYDLYGEAHTPFEWHEELFSHAKQLGITLISTPFDKSAVDLLEMLEVPAYKIASFEIVDLELISYVASKKKPLIISTGLANIEEIEAALDAVYSQNNYDVILLHCISSYPAPADDSNLRTIVDMRERFDCLVGLSDHTYGTATSVASVALGSVLIEKHFTLSRVDGGPDADFSLEPAEFKTLCRDCGDAFKSLGNASYHVKGSEAYNVKFRRSLYFCKDVKKGDIITMDNVRCIRPGYGLDPKFLGDILGKETIRSVEFGDRVTWDVLNIRTERD